MTVVTSARISGQIQVKATAMFFKQVVILPAFPTDPIQQVLYIAGTVAKYWNGSAWVTLAGGSGTQIQSDWNQTNNTQVDYIRNKPTIPAAQIQSDWNQATNTALDYIKNKPTLATVATSGSYNDLSDKPTIPTNSDFALNGLSDVDISAIGNDKILVWNSTSAKWEIQDKPAGGLDKTFQTLTYAAQIVTDGAISVNSVVILTDTTAELQLPINPVLGELFTWDAIQDAVGGRLLTYAAGFQFSGGIVPILSATPNAKDSLTFICKAANVFEFKYANFDVKTP